jgi:hypothetical protein
VDEAVQFPQDVVRDVARSARLAMQENRDVRVLVADFLDEGTQVQHGGIQFGPGREFLVVDRQDEGRRAALLLGEGSQVTVTGDPQHVETLLFDGLGQGADAEARSVLGAEVFVDDDDGEMEAHFLPTPWPPPRGRG